MQTFRDRISVVTWVAGLMLALQPVLIAPAWAFTWYPLGSPLTLIVDRDLIVGTLLVMVIVGGTQWVLTAWDLPEPHVPFREGAWALPLAIGWIALRLLPYQPTPRAWLAFLAGTLLILALSWHVLAHTAGKAPARWPASFLLRANAFAAAGTLYLWLYNLGTRSLLSATQMLVGTYLLAAALWLETPVPARLRWLYSLVAGLIIAQLAWALKQTPLSPLRAGLILLLLFYIQTAVFERALLGKLRLRVALEYVVTGLVVLVLILTLVP